MLFHVLNYLQSKRNKFSANLKSKSKLDKREKIN